MVSSAKSYRLARQAAGNGPLAWWAVWRLVRAGDRGETRVIDDVWDLWLRQPRAELWAALTRWHRPRSLGGLSLVALGEPAPPADVVEAASRTGHPIAVTARARILAGQQELVDAACEAAMVGGALAAFCVEHQLAPSDPHRAAMFFLLTGQVEQYRLADPDHSLLALAYQGASEDERSRVRARVAGEPDLVRVLADTVRRGRLARLGEREAEYLVDAFAGRRDWPGLWELARNLPVLDAAGAVQRFDGWRPVGHDAALFDALAGADLAELATSHDAAATPRRVLVPAKATSVGSIAPDGRRIAVGTSHSVDTFTFSDNAPPQHQERCQTRHNSKVLALDGDVLIINNWDRQAPAGSFSEQGHVEHDSGPATSGTYRFHRAGTLARTEDGFAALTYDQEKNARWLHLLSGDGWDIRDYERRVLDLWAELPTTFARGLDTMAIDPGSGRIALAGNGLCLAEITGDGLRQLATAPFSPGLVVSVSFSGPDRLIGVDGEKVLRVWRVDGDELRVVAERKISGSSAVDLPAAGVIAVIVWPDNTRRWVRYLDGETLADASTPSRFDRTSDPFHLFASPDGAWLGVGYFDFVELTEVGFAELVDRPLAITTPADLPVVRDRLASADPGARPFLELLHTCLVHRFGVDIAIGEDATITGRADDIALGGSA